MMDMIDDRCLEFIGSKTQELLRHGVTVYLSNKDNINKRYGGTFCGRTRKLSVAMDNGIRSFYDFLHEYSHFLQWKDRRLFWNTHIQETSNFINWATTAGLGIFNLTPAEIEKAVAGAITLEHDCESTAIALISSFQLPISVEAYSRQANANLLYYQWGRKHRQWAGSGPPLDEQDFIPHLPPSLPSLNFFLEKQHYMKYIKILDKQS